MTPDAPIVAPFDYQDMYHVGVRVVDLGQAMRTVGAGLGLTWARPVERDQPWWSPTDGCSVARLRFTYSRQGPQHVELLEGSAGSIWDPNDALGPGLHHSGIWVNDVAVTTDHLISLGWDLVAANASPEAGYGLFSYVRSPEGFMVEPVSVTVRDGMERWFTDKSGGT